MEMSGVRATKATQPKACVIIALGARTLHAPIASGSTNAETMAPLATPPESNAMPVKIGGVKKSQDKSDQIPRDQDPHNVDPC